MTEITLEFRPDLEALVLSRRKTCTTRRSKKGKRGDVFTVQGRLGLFEVECTVGGERR